MKVRQKAGIASKIYIFPMVTPLDRTIPLREGRPRPASTPSTAVSAVSGGKRKRKKTKRCSIAKILF